MSKIIEVLQITSDLCCQSRGKGKGPVDMGNDRHQVDSTGDVKQRAHSERGPGLTQEQKNTAVEYHNKLRKQEGASNMETLVRYVVVLR